MAALARQLKSQDCQMKFDCVQKQRLMLHQSINYVRNTACKLGGFEPAPPTPSFLSPRQLECRREQSEMSSGQILLFPLPARRLIAFTPLSQYCRPAGRMQEEGNYI